MNPDERNLKVGIISCKLEPPVYRSIHVVILTNFQEYFILKNIEHFFFNNLITRLKNSKIKILFFRWGSNNILESLLLSNEIDIIKWVGCIDLEIISIITKSRNISLINDINYSRVGVAHRIKEQSLKNSNKFLIIEGYFGVEVITILLFDSNSNNLSKSIKIMDTCIRSIQNFLKNKCLTYSTGIFELLIYLSLMRINKTFYNINNIFINTFVGAIETIPKIIGNIDTLKKAFTKNKLLKTQELNIDLGKSKFNKIRFI
jgi:chaperonin GroEL (HSP60 family)